MPGQESRATLGLIGLDSGPGLCVQAAVARPNTWAAAAVQAAPPRFRQLPLGSPRFSRPQLVEAPTNLYIDFMNMFNAISAVISAHNLLSAQCKYM